MTNAQIQTRMVDLTGSPEDCPICEGSRKFFDVDTEMEYDCVSCNSKVVTQTTHLGGISRINGRD